jgi:hypothetical protein
MRLLDNLRWLAGANTGTLVWAPTANRTITLPDGDGTLAFSSGGGGLIDSEITGTSATAQTGYSYRPNNVGLVTITLPTTAAAGSIIEVIGQGAGLWQVNQNASQQIHYGNISTVAGVTGRVNATHRRDCIRLVCVVANLEFVIFPAHGNIDVKDT